MNKIISFRKACKLSKNYSEKNLKSVFTHGCFDVLHLGHINLLKKSKKMGDYLFVGLLSDESVSYFKPGRPFMKFKDRALLLESIIYVDFVFEMPMKLDSEDLIYNSHIDVYRKLGACFITSGIETKKWMKLKEQQAKDVGCIFVPIDSQVNDSSSRIIKKIGF